jgi:uncharacterized protein (DUF302 family)
MGMMDAMVKMIGKNQREQMMVDMMPKMMDGINMAVFMPKMMQEMFGKITAEDVVQFIRDAITNREQFAALGQTIAEANLMKDMMFMSVESKYSFEETLEKLKASAPENGWNIPDDRDVKKLWNDEGISEMNFKATTLYFCNSEGGYAIAKDEDFRPMMVMMPMGVTVYETSTGVKVGAMNISIMSAMFAGTAGDVLYKSGKNLENTLAAVTK